MDLLGNRNRRTKQVCLVSLVFLVHLVSFVQLNKRDKPNNGLLLLADFFSILLNARVPLVALILPIPTLPAGDAGKRLY